MVEVYVSNPRSGCEHKAWGEAQRNPRNQPLRISGARGAADSCFITTDVLQSNRYRPRRGLYEISRLDDPGVSLRFTPGFMLSSAPRTDLRIACLLSIR